MMRRHSLLLSAVVALCASSAIAGAQNARAGRAAARSAGGAGRANAQQPLVRELRQRFNGVVRQQLNLNDEKARQLDRVDRQFEQQRNQLRRDEREARLGLQAAMADTANVEQAKIAQYMDQLTRGQRRRADLLEAEQKELSSFLTPLQRAKLQALREQLAQKVRQVQQQNGGGRRAAPPPLP